MSYVGVYRQGVAYKYAELVTRSGALWRCVVDDASTTPSTQSVEWQEVVPKGYFAMHVTRNVVDVASRAANESDDCSIRAIAVALQLPYSKVHEAATATGRPPREPWPHEAALCVLGAFAVELPPYLADVRAFEREFSGATGGFLLVPKGKNADHVAGAFNGVVHDWIRDTNEPLAKVLAVSASRELLKGMLFEHYADTVAKTLALWIRHYRSR